MATGARTRGKATGSSGRVEDAVVERLFRAIVGILAGVNGQAAGAQGDEDTERVVLDADVDGNRYLLVRMSRETRKTPPLSPRELEIVRMVAQGHPNKVIASLLDISSWTVCTHVRRIFAKLGVASRAAMVAKLLESDGGIERTVGSASRVTGRGGESHCGLQESEFPGAQRKMGLAPLDAGPSRRASAHGAAVPALAAGESRSPAAARRRYASVPIK